MHVRVSASVSQNCNVHLSSLSPVTDVFESKTVAHTVYDDLNVQAVFSAAQFADVFSCLSIADARRSIRVNHSIPQNELFRHNPIMFPRKLSETAPTAANGAQLDEYETNFEISDSSYGKDSVKLLHVQRHGQLHHIKEFEVNTHLKLYSKKDYLHGKCSFSIQMHRAFIFAR